MSDNNQTAERVRAEVRGRDESGRFEDSLGRVAELRRALLRSVGGEDIEAIGKAMIQKAKEGHVGAAKLIFAYVLGRPQRAADEGERPVEEEVQREAVAMPAMPAMPVRAMELPAMELPVRAMKRETRRERKARKRAEREGRSTKLMGPSPNGVVDLRVGGAGSEA